MWRCVGRSFGRTLGYVAASDIDGAQTKAAAKYGSGIVAFIRPCPDPSDPLGMLS
jgi:hypothetical protein